MTDTAQNDKELVESLFARARAAQKEYEANGSQQRYDLAAKASLEGKEGLEEVAVAAPNVAGHVETDQHGVRHQLENREGA